MYVSNNYPKTFMHMKLQGSRTRDFVASVYTVGH